MKIAKFEKVSKKDDLLMKNTLIKSCLSIK